MRDCVYSAALWSLVLRSSGGGVGSGLGRSGLGGSGLRRDGSCTAMGDTLTGVAWGVLCSELLHIGGMGCADVCTPFEIILLGPEFWKTVFFDEKI